MQFIISVWVNGCTYLCVTETPKSLTCSLLQAKELDSRRQPDGANRHNMTTTTPTTTAVNSRASLQSNSTPHLNGSLKAHKRLFDLKETINVTSTSSLHTPLMHSFGLSMDEHLRRSMPDLLDKVPSDHDKPYSELKKVNTLPHKRSKSKIVLPTPSSSFVPLNLVTQQSQQTPSPAKNSISQSTNSAFSRVTPDHEKLSDSNIYHNGREAFNGNEEIKDEPVLDTSSSMLVQPVRPNISTTTVDMATSTNGPKDSVANSHQVSSQWIL